MAHIVITGASRGIGFETALTLAKAGHRVIAIARSAERLKQLQTTAEAHGEAGVIEILPFDLTDQYPEETLLPFVRERLGHVDILINNAGTLINKPFTDTLPVEFARVMEVNFIAPVQVIQCLLPLIAVDGHIVNIGSMGGFPGSVKFPGLSAYSASKAALHTLTECLAAELTGSGIKINCLALGSAQTEMLEKAFPDYRSPVSALEMGEYIAHFAVHGHRLFNGKVIPVAMTIP